MAGCAMSRVALFLHGRWKDGGDGERMPKWSTEALSFAKEVMTEFVADDALSMSAAIAFYTVFSLAPLIVIVIVVAGLFISPEQAAEAVRGQVSGLVGVEGAQQVRAMVEEAAQSYEHPEEVIRWYYAQSQRLGEIADEILDILDADGNPHHVIAGTGGGAIFRAQLAVGGGRGVDDQRTRIADIGEMRKQAAGFDQFSPGAIAAFEAEGEHGPGPGGQVFTRQLDTGA